jgi:hypothetical protein
MIITLTGGMLSISSESKAGDQEWPFPYSPPRDEMAVTTAVQSLLSHRKPTEAILLARVVRVDGSPIGPDGQKKPGWRGILAEGGRFQTLQTLMGPEGPAFVDVDNQLDRYSQRGKGLGVPMPPATGMLGKYAYWLLVYDYSTQSVSGTSGSGTAPLTGLNDPFIYVVRRHAGWLSAPDRPRAREEMRSVLLDERQSLLSRAAALRGLYVTTVKQYMRYEGPEYAFYRRAMLDFMTQPSAPPRLKVWAVNLVRVEGRQEIAAGSDEERTIRTLIGLLKSASDQDLVIEAASSLGMIAGQSDCTPPYTAYYFPDIIAALEERMSRDERTQPGRSPAVAAVSTLKFNKRWQLEDIKGVPVVVRRLP